MDCGNSRPVSPRSECSDDDEGGAARAEGAEKTVKIERERNNEREGELYKQGNSHSRPRSPFATVRSDQTGYSPVTHNASNNTMSLIARWKNPQILQPVRIIIALNKNKFFKKIKKSFIGKSLNCFF